MAFRWSGCDEEFGSVDVVSEGFWVVLYFGSVEVGGGFMFLVSFVVSFFGGGG